MTIRKTTIKIKGQKVRNLYGGRGKTLVFLHGWSTNPLANKEVLRLLSKNFTIYAPFLFDIKFSSLKELAEDVMKLIEKLGAGKVVLAGTSFGGIIAAIIAVKRPKLVSKLVLVNTAGIPTKTLPFMMAVDSVRTFIRLLLQRKISVLIHRWISSVNFLFNFWRNGRHKLSAQLRNKSAVRSVFRKIKVKTLVLWSTNDIIYPVDFAIKINRNIKNSALAIVKGPHSWQYHYPLLFATLLVKYAT